jgi:hypothetical protein
MKNKSYSGIALNAMHRAAKEAIEKAAKLDLKIPVWENGEVVLVRAKEKLKNLNYT